MSKRKTAEAVGQFLDAALDAFKGFEDTPPKNCIGDCESLFECKRRPECWDDETRR